MLKHLIILLLTSGLYSDVIIYEPSPFVTVVKRDVKFIGIFTDGVKYKVNSSDYEFIECNLIVEILDDNENPIEFNCKLIQTYNHVYNLIKKNTINEEELSKTNQSIEVENNPTIQLINNKNNKDIPIAKEVLSSNKTKQTNLLELFGGTNPCSDEKLVILHDKSIAEVSDREFEYYKIQSKKCNEYIKYTLDSQNENNVTITNPIVNNNNLAEESISKETLFLFGKKDPNIARIFNFFIPSSGHAYIGKWEQGFPCLILSFCGVIISTSQAQTGAFFILGASIWSIIDGNKVVKEHNNELYKSIYGINMPEEFYKKYNLK